VTVLVETPSGPTNLLINDLTGESSLDGWLCVLCLIGLNGKFVGPRIAALVDSLSNLSGAIGFGDFLDLDLHFLAVDH